MSGSSRTRRDFLTGKAALEAVRDGHREALVRRRLHVAQIPEPEG